jgi:hypothetical protein
MRCAALASSMEARLRERATFALSNLVHKAAPALKQRVIAHLPWAAMAALLADSEPDVQVRVGAGCCKL